MLTPYRQHFHFFSRIAQQAALYKKTVLSLPNSELFWENVSSVGLRTPRPRVLSYEKKVPKDSPKTYWFLDFQRKGGIAPS